MWQAQTEGPWLQPFSLPIVQISSFVAERQGPRGPDRICVASVNPDGAANHNFRKFLADLLSLAENGVLFSDCNATRLDASVSEDPSIVRFDVVKAKTQYDVAKPLRQFYQAEVLVPSPIAPDLILFPNRPLYFRQCPYSE